MDGFKYNSLARRRAAKNQEQDLQRNHVLQKYKQAFSLFPILCFYKACCFLSNGAIAAIAVPLFFAVRVRCTFYVLCKGQVSPNHEYNAKSSRLGPSCLMD